MKIINTLVAIVDDSEEGRIPAAQVLNVALADDDEVGSADIEDAMTGLVEPTQGEARVANAQVLKVTHSVIAIVDDGEKETQIPVVQDLNVAHSVDNGVKAVDDNVGSADMEDAMIVEPTQGEAQVATAQFLKSTYTVVVIVDDREKEAQILAAQGLNVAHTADNGVNTVDDKVGSADIEDAMKGLVKPTQGELKWLLRKFWEGHTYYCRRRWWQCKSCRRQPRKN